MQYDEYFYNDISVDPSTFDFTTCVSFAISDEKSYLKVSDYTSDGTVKCIKVQNSLITDWNNIFIYSNLFRTNIKIVASSSSVSRII